MPLSSQMFSYQFSCIYMGQSSSAYSVSSLPSMDEWVTEQTNNFYHLVRHKHTNLEMEKNRLHQGQHPIGKQLDLYQYRKHQNSHLVKVLHVEEVNPSGICSGQHSYNIYSERIPVRLSQTLNLSLEEGLMVVRDSLIGFETIKDSYQGHLKVTDQMVGFTVEGTTKVWVNQNFHQNSPNPDTVLSGNAYNSNPSLSVINVFRTVQSHLVLKQFPKQLWRLLLEENCQLDYQRARTLIRNYSIQNNIAIPNCLDLNKHNYAQNPKRYLEPTQANQAQQRNRVRRINIIPEAECLSPKKNPRHQCTPDAFALVSNSKVQSSYKLLPFGNNIHNLSNKYCCSKLAPYPNSRSFTSQFQIDSSANRSGLQCINIPKQIQRVNSEYILQRQENSMTQNPPSLDLGHPNNILRPNSQSSMVELKSEVDSLDARIQSLVASVHLEVRRNTIIRNHLR